MPDFKTRLGQAFMTPSQLALEGAREEAARKADMLREERARQEASMRDVSYGGQAFRVPESTAANNAFEMEKLKRTPKGGMPPGMKLGMDQRWNPDTQSVEILPGSKTFLGQKDKYAKDAGQLRAATSLAKEGAGKIDFILDPKNKGGFESQFGGPQSYLTRMLPGQTQDVGAKLESLRSNLKLAGKSLVGQGGAIGQITEREWPILEGMIDTLSPNMTEEGARQVLENIKAKFQDMQRQAQETYQSEWQGSQFDQQPQQGQQIDPERQELEARRAARQRR